MYAQMGTQMVPYQPHYSYHCSIGSMNLPLYPDNVYVPIPPPPPPLTGGNTTNGNSSIVSSPGEVGQQFGGNNGYFP